MPLVFAGVCSHAPGIVGRADQADPAAKDRLYDADSKFIDERVRGDHDAWNIGLNWKKSFADGGLTKTIPPERGPMPQGLPSALYNGIMRPRSY